MTKKLHPMIDFYFIGMGNAYLLNRHKKDY
jgi:hypothetical protein